MRSAIRTNDNSFRRMLGYRGRVGGGVGQGQSGRRPVRMPWIFSHRPTRTGEAVPGRRPEGAHDAGQPNPAARPMARCTAHLETRSTRSSAIAQRSCWAHDLTRRLRRARTERESGERAAMRTWATALRGARRPARDAIGRQPAGPSAGRRRHESAGRAHAERVPPCPAGRGAQRCASEHRPRARQGAALDASGRINDDAARA